MTTEKSNVSEEQVRLIMLNELTKLKDTVSEQFKHLEVTVTKIGVTQDNYLDFMKIIVEDNKDNDGRLRNLEELKGQMESLTKIEGLIKNIEGKLDNVVTKEELDKVVTGLDNKIKLIAEEHTKNTDLRKNLAFTLAALIILVPLISKLFEVISK